MGKNTSRAYLRATMATAVLAGGLGALSAPSSAVYAQNAISQSEPAFDYIDVSDILYNPKPISDMNLDELQVERLKIKSIDDMSKVNIWNGDMEKINKKRQALFQQSVREGNWYPRLGDYAAGEYSVTIYYDASLDGKPLVIENIGSFIAPYIYKVGSYDIYDNSYTDVETGELISETEFELTKDLVIYPNSDFEPDGDVFEESDKTLYHDNYEGGGVYEGDRQDGNRNFHLPTTHPTRAGYEFVEWGYDVDGLGFVLNPGDYFHKCDPDADGTPMRLAMEARDASDDIINGTCSIRTDANLYAQWLEIPDLTFDMMSDKLEDVTLTDVWVADIIADPVLKDHEFLGFYDNPDYTGEAYASDSYTFNKGDSNKTFYAKWKTIPGVYYYEDFDPELGLDGNTADVYEPNVTGTTTYMPQRDGYTFLNWEEKEVIYDAGEDVEVSTVMHFVANWAPDAYVAFNENYIDAPIVTTKGVIDIADDYSYTHSASTYTPQREGYKFVGWSDSEGNVYQDTFDIPSVADGETFTLFAAWEEVKEPEVTPEPEPDVEDPEVTPEPDVDEPEITPEPDVDEPEITPEPDVDEPEVVLYDVSYNENHANGAVKVFEDIKQSTTYVPERAGYKFIQWVDSNGVAYNGTFDVSSNLELFAQWKAIPNVDVDLETSGTAGLATGALALSVGSLSTLIAALAYKLRNKLRK